MALKWRLSRFNLRKVGIFPIVPGMDIVQLDQVVPLLPAIIVLNYNYLPKSFYSPAKVGATASAMSAVQVLKEVELIRGFILYKRHDGLQQLIITTQVRESILCATIVFNFEMETGLLKKAVGTTAELLACVDNFLPMLYYDTETLPRYPPDHPPLCVTHNGPFYEDFAHHFSDELAGTAFGSQQKA
jgi:hypothetical protein